MFHKHTFLLGFLRAYIDAASAFIQSLFSGLVSGSCNFESCQMGRCKCHTSLHRTRYIRVERASPALISINNTHSITITRSLYLSHRLLFTVNTLGMQNREVNPVESG